MSKLASQQKIIEFLNEEFAKIKTQQQANKRLKLKAVEKKVRKLLNSFDNDVHLKIIEVKNEIKNYFLYLKL